jgi:hypothetical protein
LIEPVGTEYGRALRCWCAERTQIKKKNGTLYRTQDPDRSQFKEAIFGPDKWMERKPHAPGQHGPNARRRKKESEYSLQLQEKQKAKYMYGILERQFEKMYHLAASKRASPVRCCCNCARRDWTIRCTAWASPPHVVQHASW